MKKLSLIVFTLALLLAACGGNEAKPESKTSTPAQPAKTLSQAELSKSVQKTRTTSLSLGEALADDEVTVALTNLPANNPVGGFMSAPEMLNLARPNLKASSAQLSTLAVMEAFKLERGVYSFNETSEEWEKVGESDDFEGSWSFENGDSTSQARVVIDWNALSATQSVTDGDYSYEVPTGMNLSMDIDGQKAADLDAEFAWYSGAGCADIYQPTRIALDGFVGVSDKVTVDNASYQISDTATTDTVSSAGKISAVAGADSGELSWNVSVNGELERDEYCYVEFGGLSNADINFAYDVNANGETSGLAFGVKISDIDADNASLVLSDGSLEISGEGRIDFAGKLDDADQNGIPGDSVVLNFAEGQSVTLESYIQQDFMTAAYVVRQLNNIR